MSLGLEAVRFDVAQPREVAAFWGSVLGRPVVAEADAAFLAGNDTQVGLRFARRLDDSRTLDRLHLHLTTTSDDDQRHTVDAVLALGGRHLDVGQLPEELHVVLADPEGTPFCVIEPGNSFLAGCGRLGEVACDGSREVGLFWRDALGWNLVWDNDGETAVQSPAGGTKIAWGGLSETPGPGRSARQGFDLRADDVEAEVARLETLGATTVSERGDGVGLLDPDGNDFSVRLR